MILVVKPAPTAVIVVVIVQHLVPYTDFQRLPNRRALVLTPRQSLRSQRPRGHRQTQRPSPPKQRTHRIHRALHGFRKGQLVSRGTRRLARGVPETGMVPVKSNADVQGCGFAAHEPETGFGEGVVGADRDAGPKLRRVERDVAPLTTHEHEYGHHDVVLHLSFLILPIVLLSVQIIRHDERSTSSTKYTHDEDAGQ